MKRKPFSLTAGVMISAAACSFAAGSVVTDFHAIEGPGSGGGPMGMAGPQDWVWASQDHNMRTQFDGVNDYESFANSPEVNVSGDALTISTWVKWSIDPSGGSNWASLVNKNVDGQYRLHHNRTNEHFEFAIRTTSGNRWVVSETSPVADQWYHLAGVYDGSWLHIYVDGVLENSANWSGTILASNSPLEIGRRAVAHDRYFEGMIDDVRIYDRALSGSEIQGARLGRPCSEHSRAGVLGSDRGGRLRAAHATDHGQGVKPPCPGKA